MASSLASHQLFVLIFFVPLSIIVANFDEAAFLNAPLECNCAKTRCFAKDIAQAKFGFAKPKKQFQIHGTNENKDGIINSDMAKFENALLEGAFLDDYIGRCPDLPMTMTTTTIKGPTEELTKNKTSESSTATTQFVVPSVNPIICTNTRWAQVKPAKIFGYAKDGSRFVEDYALRAGFIEYIPKKFSDVHVNEAVKELIEESKAIFGEIRNIGSKLADWLKENAEWLQGIKHGEIQYFRIADEFGREGEIMMLIGECSFGKFIFGPVQLDNSVQIAENFDWTQDFEHLDDCVERQMDIFAEQEPSYYKRRYVMGTNKKVEVKLNFHVGFFMNEAASAIPFDGQQQKCEAFKYKYGYTSPLRSPALAEGANNWERVKRMGRLLMPIEWACNVLTGFDLTVFFRVYDPIKLFEMGLASQDCEQARRNGANGCMFCTVTDGSRREKSCSPFVNCQVVQTVYECGGKKFRIQIPRVDGRANFNMNGTNYSFNDRSNGYNVVGRDYSARINVPYDIGVYKLYNDEKRT